MRKGMGMILRKCISIQAKERVLLKLQLLWTILSQLLLIHLAMAHVEIVAFHMPAATEWQ
jgi:hypothetical protein